MKNKLKKSVFLLSSLMMLSVGVGIVNHVENTVNVAEAAETTYSYTFTSKLFTANGTKTLNGVEWKLAGCGGYFGYDGTKGQQFGSGSKPSKSMTLTSAEFTNVTSITINTSGASSINGSFTTSVGGTQVGTSTKLTSSAANYSFTCDNLSGAVVFSYTQTSSKALYIKSISVTYDDGITVDPVKNHTVTFYNDDEIFATKTVKDGNTVENPGNPDAEDGFRFVQWCSDSELTKKFDFDTPITADTSVYAGFEKLPENLIYDTLNQSFTGVTDSTYTAWSGKNDSSNAVYDGLCAGSNKSIQLRSTTDKNYSGIISITSGGHVRTISAEFDSSTQVGRTLNVYGKNSAYEEVKDLYAESTYGTLLGTITNGTNEFLTIDGDYEYVGLRSANGAMYISELQIGWEENQSGGETPNPDTPVVETYDVTFNSDGGTAVESLVVNKGDLVTKPADPTKEGFTFIGWTLNGNDYDFNTPVTNDIELVAKWEENASENPDVPVDPETPVATLSAKLVSDGSKDYVAAGDTTDYAERLGIDTSIFSVTFETNNCTNTSGIARLNETGTGLQVYGGNYQGTAAEQANGAAVVVKVEDGQNYTIASIEVDVISTKGYSVNGGAAVKATGKTSFNINGKEFKVQSVTSTQTKIASITINYVDNTAKSAINYQYDNDEAPTAVRFIGTLSNVDAETIESVSLSFVKDGVAANKEVELYTLYTSVADTFAAADNTYYVVYVLNGVQEVLNQELQVTMRVTFNNGAEALVATRTFTLGA